MPESTLSLSLYDYAAEVGRYLGFGATASNWTGWNPAAPYVSQSILVNGQTVGALDTQLGQVMICVNRGYRQFLYPRVAEAGEIAHKWSFLTPQRVLQVIAGQNVYDLPDDYGNLDSEFTYQPTDSTWLTIKRVGIGQVSRCLQTLFGVQDKPCICAVFPKPTDGVAGQRFQVQFAPTPDSTYSLTYTSTIIPPLLNNTAPFPYGGAAHSDTIMESCLAVAESMLQDEQGNHKQTFLERLQASITADTRENRPAYMGPNLDRSDWNCYGYGAGYSPWGAYPWGTLTAGVTYNGIQY